MTKGFVKGSACDTCGRELGVRNKFGRCVHCRTRAFQATLQYDHDPDQATLERILYYQARAALGLDLFEGSPWARLPGAHQRALETQSKLTGTTGRVAPTDQAEESALHVALGHVSFSTGGGRQ